MFVSVLMSSHGRGTPTVGVVEGEDEMLSKQALPVFVRGVAGVLALQELVGQ